MHDTEKSFWLATTLVAALAMTALATPVWAAETTGPNGTYECWDRCVASVGCNTSCYNYGELITCGQYSSSCGGSEGGTVGQYCGDGYCLFDANLGTETPCNCPSDCRAPRGDKDVDGIPDTLEADLADRFFPDTLVRWSYSDAHQFYTSYAAGKIPFLVTPIEGDRGLCLEDLQCLEIRIGMAYNWDCGDDPENGCRTSGTKKGHRGDSEFYMAYVARKAPDGSGSWGVPWSTARTSASYWRLIMDFTSAHFLADFIDLVPVDSSKFAYYVARDDNAVILAAEGKHAMYHTPEDCDAGGFLGADHCGAQLNLKSSQANYSSSKLKNMGNGGCHANFDSTIPYPAASPSGTPSGVYDIWSWQPFGSSDAASYTSSLARVFDWPRQHQCVVALGPWCAGVMVFPNGDEAYLYHWRTFDAPFSCYCP